MALKNPRIKHTVTIAGQKPFERVADVTGYVSNRDKLITLLKHPWGEDDTVKITNLRQVDAITNKDLPEQPDELKEAVESSAPELPAIP